MAEVGLLQAPEGIFDHKAWDCSSCPFGGTKVYGEGTRILDHKETLVTKGAVSYKLVEDIRDDYGTYDVVVVGMAPARNEISQGRVFVGDSGKFLRSVLNQLGIREFYVCSVLLCQITNDDLQNLAVGHCKERVVKEIIARKPKLVIALGEMPVKLLVESNYTITQLQGRIIPSTTIPGLPILPIAHPAYFLRHPTEAMDFIEAARVGARFLEGTYYQADTNPEFELVNNDNFVRIMEDISKREKLSLDTETNGLYPYGKEPHRALELGVGVSGNKAYIFPAGYIHKLKILESKKNYFWNASFDAAFMKQHGITPYVHFDGMIGHSVLDERAYGHGLKRVAKIYIGADDWDKPLKDFLNKRGKADMEKFGYSIVPPEMRHPYLAKDVCYTYDTCEVIEKSIGSSNKLFWELLMPALRMFIEIRHHGIRVDSEKFEQLIPDIEQELETLQKDITFQLRGNWINPQSPAQVATLLYDILKIPPDPFYGMRSTAKEWLNKLAEDFPLVSDIIRYRELSKLKGTYIEGIYKFVDYDSRIHPNINLAAAETGRLSSEDPSIMNLRRDKLIKRLFLPDEDKVFGYGDIKGNELRWYCIKSKDQKLIQVLNEGGDPHNDVATVAFGASRAREMRTDAKTVVFGRMYGSGRKSIEARVGPGVIEDLLIAVDSVFPNVKNYRKQIEEELRKGYVESFFGRRRRFPLITEEVRGGFLRQAVNAPIQGDGSDMMLSCFLHLWENKEKFGIYPTWPVHDSITSSMESVETLPLIKKELEEYCYERTGRIVPFVWDMDWGINWAMDKPEGK